MFTGYDNTELIILNFITKLIHFFFYYTGQVISVSKFHEKKKDYMFLRTFGRKNFVIEIIDRFQTTGIKSDSLSLVLKIFVYKSVNIEAPVGTSSFKIIT